ncbi:MAG: L-lysine 6-transaminase [Vicinamibacterales bacterium]
MPVSTLGSISPLEVHVVLARHLLADGYDFVLDFERSHGAWLHDAKSGREFLDFCMFFASNPVGYNHPKLRDPEFLEVLHRVASLKPSLPDFYSVEYASFVETFGRLAMPEHMRYAFFVEGGALGVENAIKAAFDWKVRRNQAKGIPGEKGQQVIHFRQAFHGRSGYTLSLTNTDPRKTDYFPKFPWPRIDNPGLRFPVTPEVERDTAEAETRALDAIERAFAENTDDIAAIIIEPIQAEGGDVHFRPDFLRALETKAREHDVFFILDEVQTGVGITGKMWAHEHWGLRPDAVAFGKKLQVGGCMVGPRVDEAPDNVFKLSSRINSTWGGNLTDMVRSARMLEILVEDGLLENARVMGERLLAGLIALAGETGGKATNARGLGLMLALDLETPELRERALERTQANGLLLLPCGARSIRLRPPLNLAAAEADTALELVRKSLKEL